jgi:hypothetical protein
MSDGLNKAFKDDPLGFLQKNVFASQPDNSLVSRCSGQIVFNLTQDEKTGQINVTATPSGSIGSHPLNGFWLANVRGKCETLSLGGAGDFMFTPALTGCRFVIDPTGPKVSHIDGGVNDAGMNKICNVKATGANQSAVRYWDNGNYYASVVVGVRLGGAWAFYAQSYNYGAKPPLTTTKV